MSQSLLCRHRNGHILALLVVVLLAAASDGDPAGDTYNCQSEPSTCGHLSVRYPFHVYNGAEDAPTEYGEPRSYCGYPGLAIHCDDDEKPILRLGGDDYAVSNIDYTTLTVSLADADVAGDCPTVSHNVTVPSPFHVTASAVAYLFLFTDCTFPPDAEFAPKPPRKPPGIKPITCSGSSEPEPAATNTMSFVLPELDDVPPKGELWRACRSVHSAAVLRDAVPADAQSVAWRDGGYARALRGGFQVSWDRVVGSGPCGRCEQSGA
jgi:hypothetical protein